jgi:hypothetical protein
MSGSLGYDLGYQPFFFAWLKLYDCTPEKAPEYFKIQRRRPNVFGSYSRDTPIGEDSGMTWLHG